MLTQFFMSQELIDARQLDLTSLESIGSFAESIKAKEPRLDILICNAGVLLLSAWHGAAKHRS